MIANLRNVMFRNGLSYNMIYFQSVSLFAIAVFFRSISHDYSYDVFTLVQKNNISVVN